MGSKKNYSLLFFTLPLQLLAFCFVLIQPAPESARITYLPGFNHTFPSNHYSGYVDIGGAYQKELFYYFVESEDDPIEDPVVLWLNGGPGCSSFDGFVYEHGPFNFEAQTDLPLLNTNSYSWSKVSNIIYLDSPVGVGFSYSQNTTDYQTGDFKTASESHKFLLEWFKLYPEYLSNPFFVAGESFAGVYVPTLASEILNGIYAGLQPVLNLKGYLVGNGVTDENYDGNALIPFAHGMGLIPDELFELLSKECSGNFYSDLSDSCESLNEKVDEDLKQLNIYNILEPCFHGAKTKDIINDKLRLPSSFKNLGETERPSAVRKRMFGRSWPLRAPVKPGFVPTWPELNNIGGVPCTDDRVATVWLNDERVRKAIHAKNKDEIGSWDLCTDKINYTHDAGSMLVYHKYLTTQGIRALIYSGDHDMCVPFTGSEAWTRAMGYDVMDEWRPWFVGDQVVGFTVAYANNLTFATIKGSGHTVPEYKPKEALAFYSRFLAGYPI